MSDDQQRSQIANLLDRIARALGRAAAGGVTTHAPTRHPGSKRRAPGTKTRRRAAARRARDSRKANRP